MTQKIDVRSFKDSFPMRLRHWNLEAERKKKHQTDRGLPTERRAYRTLGGINDHQLPGKKTTDIITSSPKENRGHRQGGCFPRGHQQEISKIYFR